MTAHACPYDGAREMTDLEREQASVTFGWIRCGARGHLCLRCREDRADARVRSLVAILNDLTNAISERP